MSDEEEEHQRKEGEFYTLTSICIISHFQFFSNFKECALILRRLINGANHAQRSQHRRYDAWKLLCDEILCHSKRVLRLIQDIESWISRLLQAPIPLESESRLEMELFPSCVLTFALPDKDRFSMCDFPLHLPLELLGVNKCLKVIRV